MNNNGWTMAPLSEAVTHRKEFIEIDDSTTYKRCRVKLHAQGIVLRDQIDGALIKTKTQQVCRPDEFLVAEIDAKMGGFGLVPEELDGAIVSSHYFLFTPKPDQLVPRFLGYYCRTPAFREQVTPRGTTNYAAIRPSHVLDYTIPLPPLEEQQRIVARIDRLAAKIEEAQSLQTRINADIKALVASLHASLSRGRLVRMDALVELFEERVPVEATRQYPQVGIKGFGGGLFPKPPLSGADTTYRYFNQLSSGLLVLSQVKGWEGAIAVCSKELSGYFASPEYRTFRCIEGSCDPQYLDTIVRSTWFRQLLQNATHGQGARRERTRPERFLTLELPMPDLDDQRIAATIVSKLTDTEPLRSHTTAAREALLPSILDRAFRGEL